VFGPLYHVQTMYNIKRAAARAGVSVPVLRAWERRYGIVSPLRSASGYRRFDEAAVERIRTMRGLVDDGWSPSAAAAAIVAGEIPVAIAAPAEAGDPSVPPASSAETMALELADRFVAAARALDAVAVEAVLDDLFSRGSFERVARDLLFPSLERLGDAWAAGLVSVAGEHLAAGAVLRRLGLALDAAGQGARARPLVIVGLPPGARHELGALAFAVAARRAGLAVTYLGADLPVADWATAAANADAAVIGVVTRRDRKGAVAVVHAIRATRPEARIAFGGDAAPDEPGVIRLPGELTDAVATLDEELRRAAA